MPDHDNQQSADSPEQATQQPPSLSTEIAAALSSVRARYVGERPSSSEVNLDDGVVRWTHAGDSGGFEAPESDDGADGEPEGPERTAAGYERETSAAVARATRRRVRARMSRHDKKAGIATETFVLEAKTKKY